MRSLPKWVARIEYIAFPQHLRGAYQSFTQADLTALRQAGCKVEFAAVNAGIEAYLTELDNTQ